MHNKYQVGFFEWEECVSFHPCRAFDTKREAFDFVWRNFGDAQDEDTSDNIVILHQRRIVFDGRWVRLN